MKKENWIQIVKTLLMPALLMVLGVVLIVNPDSAAALIGKIIAWALLLAGTGMGIGALYGDPGRRIWRLIPAVLAILAGIWLMANPLFIAESLGRILGILLIAEGVSGLGGALRGERLFPVMPVITLLAGIGLVLVPMTTSRIVFVICGIVVLCIGAAEMVNRLVQKKPEKKGEKARIIDEAP